MAEATRFKHLPDPQTSQGAPRRIGVEVEFSGLDTDEVVRIVQGRLGGSPKGDDPFGREILGTSIGDVTIELDTSATQASDTAVVRKGLDIASAVIPLEIITEPLDQDALAAFDNVLAALRQAGATGSRSGVLLGFGVHLNPDVVAADDARNIRIIRAYGLLEAYLRRLEKLDLTRRVLPFVSPLPKSFVTAILRHDVETLADLLPVVADHITSRNYGLDLLPLLKHAHRDDFEHYFPDTKTSARPAYHFRLPDCRIDEPDWTLLNPWALWYLVETVAGDRACLADLTQAWRKREKEGSHDQSWADETAAVLGKHGLEQAA